MDSASAAEILEDVDEVKESTRGLLDAAWFPLLLWGVIVLASAPFTQIADGEAVGYYWLCAGPIGALSTFAFYWRREIDLGLVARHKVAYITTSISIAAGSMVLGFAGQGRMLSAVGPVFVVAVGLAVFAVLDASRTLAAAAAALLVLGGALLVLEPAEATLWAAIGEGLILIVVAIPYLQKDFRTDSVGIAQPRE